MYFWRNQPSEHISEDDIVTKRNNVLYFPKDRSRVPKQNNFKWFMKKKICIHSIFNMMNKLIFVELHVRICNLLTLSLVFNPI